MRPGLVRDTESFMSVIWLSFTLRSLKTHCYNVLSGFVVRNPELAMTDWGGLDVLALGGQRVGGQTRPVDDFISLYLPGRQNKASSLCSFRPHRMLGLVHRSLAPGPTHESQGEGKYGRVTDCLELWVEPVGEICWLWLTGKFDFFLSPGLPLTLRVSRIGGIEFRRVVGGWICISSPVVRVLKQKPLLYSRRSDDGQGMKTRFHPSTPVLSEITASVSSIKCFVLILELNRQVSTLLTWLFLINWHLRGSLNWKCRTVL